MKKLSKWLSCMVVFVLVMGISVVFAVPSGFPDGFTAPMNTHLKRPITGFGGGGGAITHDPVIFLPGAFHGAEDFQPVYDYLLSRGYTPNELWALTYGTRSPAVNELDNHVDNAENIALFVDEVLRYTKTINPKVTKVDLIGHSLGGSLGRYYMKKFNAYDKIGALVMVAAGNHGVTLCVPGLNQNNDELYVGSPFLKALNEPVEAPGPTRYMTLYDGTGEYDTAFTGDDKDSPAIKGAENHPLSIEFGLHIDHFTALTHQKALELMYDFLSKSKVE